MPDKDEEVYVDGYIKIHAKRWYQIADALTRRDEIQKTMLKVLGAINEKLVSVPTVPPALPAVPALPVVPLIDTLVEEYMSHIRALPVSRVGRYTGTATTPQSLASWNVGHVWAKRYGMLKEISVVSNNFPNTMFRLRVELGEPISQKVVLFDNVTIQAALTIPFPENRLTYGTWVYLDCWSTGPAIIVDGSIAGTEWR